MKKLTLLALLLTSIFSYAQIDYKGLVKNLENITIETDLNVYFEGLPIKQDSYGISFGDERFLQFHQIFVDKVEFDSSWNGKHMDITFFNEKEDYNKLKAKLIEKYGEPEENIYDNSITYTWDTDTEAIYLKIDKEEELFTSFDSFKITFKNN